MPSVVAALLALQLAGTAPSQPTTMGESRAEERPGRSALSVGVLELRHGSSAVGQVGLEVRVPWAPTGPVTPLVAIALTSAASAFGFGGMALDVPLGARLRITPSLSM